MPLRTFNPTEIAKLKQLMNEGIQVTGEVEALREGLKDTVKAISEEMDMKPATLNKAIRIAYKKETIKLPPIIIKYIDNGRTITDVKTLLFKLLIFYQSSFLPF